MKNSKLEVGHTNLQALKLKKSALSEKNKNLSQEFMKMKAQKEVLEWVFIMLIM
jgi:predicted nuclease with TOPRIM domain